jgi:hypothetical protein
MSLDFGINKQEVRYILSILIVITGYSLINPYIVEFITEKIPYNGFVVGLLIMILGVYVFKLK